MTDVKLFYENAPFQVKGLYIAKGIKNMQRLLLFFLQREEKKEKKILKYRLISYANTKGTRLGKNITEIGS